MHGSLVDVPGVRISFESVIGESDVPFRDLRDDDFIDILGVARTPFREIKGLVIFGIFGLQECR